MRCAAAIDRADVRRFQAWNALRGASGGQGVACG